eukprot:TRINITY_DN14796_c0_g1_i1.p1 TRINITY_DN14796_c0_g1~~TRINITY_DN14796_c0_g1_i1.p1  ORF type:complete len:743 (+),score=205.51 TRINITY_DN14796_c0_g1_i1:75-2303(+)
MSDSESSDDERPQQKRKKTDKPDVGVLADGCARATGLNSDSVRGAIDLLLGGCTVPFIARYRADNVRGLSEDGVLAVQRALVRQTVLEEKRARVLQMLSGEPGSEAAIEAARAATTLTALDDARAPFKKCRDTLAGKGKDAGLQPAVDALLAGRDGAEGELSRLAQGMAAEKVREYVEALVVHALSHSPDLREMCREELLGGTMTAVKIKAAPKGDSLKAKKARERRKAKTYANYYEFAKPVRALQNYQILAIDRGHRDGVLRVSIQPADGMSGRVHARAIEIGFRGLSDSKRSKVGEILASGFEKALTKSLVPTAKRHIQRDLSSRALDGAAQVFARNLRPLLRQQPLKGATVLALDPGFAHGTKCAVVLPTGAVAAVFTVHPLPPQSQAEEAATAVLQAIKKHGVTHCGVGNGHGSRQCEKFLLRLLKANALSIPCAVVSESGASVYSASAVAQEELPEMSCNHRSAVFIARSLIDPLERCKVDPTHLGIGQYQHDVQHKKLAAEVDEAMKSVVSSAGVDVNTASPHTLRFVAGLHRATASAIAAHRSAVPGGRFSSREELRKVKGLGPKSFQQCAGFLRLYQGSNPLDATGVHPEQYGCADRLLKLAGCSRRDLTQDPRAAAARVSEAVASGGAEAVAAQLGQGVLTVRGVVEDLKKLGADPRDDFGEVRFRADVTSTAQLRAGVELQGWVTNVVDFGAFVDVGVENDGLLHRSVLPASPFDCLAVGDVVQTLLLRRHR